MSENAKTLAEAKRLTFAYTRATLDRAERANGENIRAVARTETALFDFVEALASKVEALEADAGRYRTLRSLEMWPSPNCEYRAGLCVDLWGEDGCGVQVSGEELDTALDNAIAQANASRAD